MIPLGCEQRDSEDTTTSNSSSEEEEEGGEEAVRFHLRLPNDRRKRKRTLDIEELPCLSFPLPYAI